MLYEIMLPPDIHCGTKPTRFLSTGRVSINPRSGAPKAQPCDLLWVKTSLITDLLLVFMATWSQKTQWFFSWRACQLHRREMCQSRGLMAKWWEQKDGMFGGAVKEWKIARRIHQWKGEGRWGLRKARRNKKRQMDGEAGKRPSWERKAKRKRQYEGNWKAWA